MGAQFPVTEKKKRSLKKWFCKFLTLQQSKNRGVPAVKEPFLTFAQVKLSGLQGLMQVVSELIQARTPRKVKSGSQIKGQVVVGLPV